jgi:hypothetical protein
MTRLASLSCGALAGLLHTRALADASGAPAGQHGFLAIRVERDQETVLARYPVQAAGSADFAYECAELACEKARVPRSPGVYGVNAYVLEIYAPEDIAEGLEPGQPEDPQYLATFTGQAWISDNAIPVDDGRFSFPVTAREVADADDDFDSLAQAIAAPAIVREWSGPFDIRIDLLEGKRPQDVDVFNVDTLPEDDADAIGGQYAVQYADGTMIGFETDDEACALQRRHRAALGLDEETGR